MTGRDQFQAQDGWMSIPEVEAYLSVSRSTVNSLIRRGELPRPVEIGPRMRRIPRKAVVDLMDRLATRAS